MTRLAAGRQRSVMASPIRPSMLVGVTPRLHPEIVRSRNETMSSLLFTTGSSHVGDSSREQAVVQRHFPGGRILVELQAIRKLARGGLPGENGMRSPPKPPCPSPLPPFPAC